MAEYRIYVIGSDGHITSAKPLVCDSDEQATERASTELPGKTLEIWSGDRFVIKLYPDT